MPRGEAISKRKGFARRYWRYVNGRVHILENDPHYKNRPRIEIIRAAQQTLKPLFIEYAVARKVSYDLFNNKRVRDSFYIDAQTGKMATSDNERQSGFRRLQGAIRVARSNQARLRGEITRQTGVGLMSMMGEDEKIRGES
jgi:hypothetical protein